MPGTGCCVGRLIRELLTRASIRMYNWLKSKLELGWGVSCFLV